jgi:cytochrome c553
VNTLASFLLAAAALGANGVCAAADIAAGQVKAKDVCQACHGMDGNSPNADYPKLGGQHPDYIAKALRDYKSGLRKNPIMAGFAGTLSKEDIENLAAYYASQPAAVVTKH